MINKARIHRVMVITGFLMAIGVKAFPYPFGETLTETPNRVILTEKSTNSSKVPPSLTAIAEYGESIYDDIKAKNWDSAENRYQKLITAQSDLPPDVMAQTSNLKDLNVAINDLANSISTKNQQKGLESSNSITLITAEMIKPYQPRVPVDVNKLDYYGRELEIWSQNRNLEKLKGTSNQMAVTWNSLRPDVIKRGGHLEAKRFDNLMNRLAAAKTATQYGMLATPILDEMDNIEQVFK